MGAFAESTAGRVSPRVLPSERTRRALIAVEDSFAREILAEKLRALDFAVQEAESSESASEKLRTFRPDVTFLFFSTRSRAAAEFIKQVRQNPELVAHPICVCTLWSSLRTTSPRLGTEPTRYYNLLSTSMDAAIREVTAEVVPGGRAVKEQVVEARRSELWDGVDHRFRDVTEELKAFCDEGAEQARSERCPQLSAKLRSLIVCAAVAGMCATARFAAAMERLFEELSVERRHLTDSCVRTIVTAIDMLDTLHITSRDCGEQALSELQAVVFADADNARLETLSALADVGFQTTSFSRQESAVAHLTGMDADLIVIHSHTPEGEIVDLCQRIRRLAKHRTTSLIVAGSSAQFACPENVLSVGAAEIMVHPFAVTELALKSLNLVQNPSPTGGIISESIQPESQREQQGVDQQFPVSAPQQTTREDGPMNAASETLDGQTGAFSELQAPEQDHQRCRELEDELEAFNRRYLELDAKLSAQCKNTSEAQVQIGELKRQLHERSEELQNAKRKLAQTGDERAQFETERAKLAEEKGRIEAELKTIREAKELADERSEAPCEAAVLAEYRIRMSAELECERAEKRRQEQRLAGLAKDLEVLHARASEYFECERLTQAKLSGLEQTLQERDEALARAAADVHKEAAERALMVEQLRAAEALVAELRDGGVVFISAKNALQHRHEELETRLQAAMSAVNEAQSQLQNERRERAKLEEKLTSLQRQLQEQIIETSKFQCANEVGQAERKRLEGDAIQLRYASAGAARTSLLAVNQLQNEVREPLDKIVAATRRLLELETGEDTNKLIQCVLVNGLAMQNKLQEFTPPSIAHAESQPPATSGT